VIDYTEAPDWDEKAREQTDGRGVDCVIEIGGPGTIAKSLKALAVGGYVSLIGARVVRHFMALPIGRANVLRIGNEAIRTGTLLVG
jgi:NADPH:quinone reductase-like Zn-dependent oxidoreductase